jgi:hypothetical protein
MTDVVSARAPPLPHANLWPLQSQCNEFYGNQGDTPASWAAFEAANSTVPAPFGGSAGGLNKFIVEDAADALSAQHRVNHRGDQVAYDTVDGMITEQGWFRSEGDLWYNHVRDSVTLTSPMLIPGGLMSVIIKEVISARAERPAPPRTSWSPTCAGRVASRYTVLGRRRRMRADRGNAVILG